MPRPIYAVIHQNNLVHNLNIAKSKNPQSLTYAVIKANAYGHGIENVYASLKNADGFALLDLEEAIKLRELGWKGPILLLEGIFHAEDLSICHKYKLQFAIHTSEQIAWLENDTITEAKYHIFLKINSGMNRLGFSPKHYSQVWYRLKTCKNVKSITHMTHFSDSDLKESHEKSNILNQISIFKNATENLPGEFSLSNSAAILGHPRIKNHIQRAGILLYGSSPDYPEHQISDWNLKPAMSLRSEIISIQQLNAGDRIGYGSTYVAQQNMKVAVVACGYADGYQRITQNGTPVLVNGKRATIVGRVSMDMLTIDVDHLPDIKLGDEVTLWGLSSTGEVLSIDEVAAGSGTIGYELMCGVTKRVKFFIQPIDEKIEENYEFYQKSAG